MDGNDLITIRETWRGKHYIREFQDSDGNWHLFDEGDSLFPPIKADLTAPWPCGEHEKGAAA